MWRIDPFAYCPHGNSDDPDDANCGIGRVKFANVEGAFTDTYRDPDTGEAMNVFDINKCSINFAVAVTNLEYINEENIAVTILNASFEEYDPFTGNLKANAIRAQYKVLFLSTETLAFAETPWNREGMLTAHSEGMLCPAMRRLPNLGSMTTEIIVAGVELVRKVFDLAITLPGLVEIWGKQQSCSLVTHGHSFLRKCGSDMLLLDDFFEAINRANAHFWRSFSLIAERIRSLDEDNLANIVDGVAYYGESTISPMDVYKSIIVSTKVPTKELGTQFIQGILPMSKGAMANELAISANPMRMAQFSYNLIATTISDILPLAVKAGKDSRNKEVIRQILAVLNNKIYQARDAYYGSITLGMIQVLTLSLSCLLSRKHSNYTAIGMIQVLTLSLSCLLSRKKF